MRDELIGGRERVRARPLEDQQRHGRALVEIAVGAVVLRAELDPADVGDARDAAVRVGLDHDPLEVVGVVEPALGLDVELEGGVGRDRRLVQDARCDLHVLRADRRHHLARGQVARRDLLRIEPDPHRVVARAEHAHVADAVDPGEHVAHLQRRVVGDVELVARLVRRAEVDHHQHVGRVLAHRDAEAADLLGQARLGDRDPVLHQHLGGIEIGAEREGHGQRQLAVAGRLADHVEHVVDAVDLLLERRRHGIAHGLGRGARDSSR